MRTAALCLALTLAGTATRAIQVPASLEPPVLPAALGREVDPIINAAWSSFDMHAALGHVQFISRYWRLPGNEGYDRTVDRVRARLIEAGFPERNLRVEEYPTAGRGWDHSIGTLAIAHPGRPDEVLLSKAKQHIALCINSFSTPPGGVVAPLVDVGRGDRDDDFASKDLKGAVVLGDADVGQLWRRAIARGAIGVVSPALGDYISPDVPGARPTPRDQWDVLQWSSIPYDDAAHGFGFKATPKAAATMRRALARGPVKVHVTIASSFSTNPTRTLVAEIPGTTAPDERIVIAAHIQEPGANDNASGVATLTELVRALSIGIQQRRIPAPARTLTFLWLNEISGSRQWLTDHADQAKNVRYMLSMDMTGEDVKKTGGSFLIERWPDPGAVWDRPWDPHSEWGRGNVRAEQLKGDLINDLHLAICARVAKKTNWIVKTNPYEGGSDHTVFGAAGVPSVLNWHFTDRYYHSSLDTADKTSPTEMRNVGVSVAATAWLMASAKETDALSVAEMVSAAGQKRIAIETREGPKVPLVSPSQDVASRETTILAAWRKWYGEAVMSATRLVVGQASPAFEGQLRELAGAFSNPSSSVGRTFRSADESVESVLLAADRLQADRWYSPPAVDPPAGAPEDWAMLRSALTSANAEVRRVAVRAFGRFENVSFVPSMLQMLDDRDARVRDEATNAICIALRTTNGGDIVLRALKAFQDHNAIAAIGRLRLDSATADQVERWLLARVDQSARLSDETIGALAGIARSQTGRLLLPQSRDLLRRAVQSTNGTAPNILAMQTLQPSHDLDDSAWLVAASRYHCPGQPEDCGWPVRYAAVQLLDTRVALEAAAIAQARHDDAFEVRLAALRRLASCPAFLEAAASASELPVVRLEAMRSRTTRVPSVFMSCTDKQAAAAVIGPIADELSRASSRSDWHAGARALEVLPRFDPVHARQLIRDAALTHPMWQVRAAAAVAATTLNDEATLLALAKDASANVRSEALTGLASLESAARVPAAIAALDGTDHQLLREAATVIPASADRDLAVPALLRALDRLTGDGKDNSRDARVTILKRLQELRASVDLSAYLGDFDPAVAAAAADAIAASGQPRPSPHPARRAPQQAAAADLRSLPAHATITMADGSVMALDLLVDQAPLTVARFAALARAGYYDGLTFHRVEPLFVIQGGSPGASEYTGDARFMRDEVGARHVRGAVGISTRGRDTGDAQIFIDLTDQPRLNDNYTVFAQVRDVAASYTVMDRVAEGAVIKSIRIN